MKDRDDAVFNYKRNEILFRDFGFKERNKEYIELLEEIYWSGYGIPYIQPLDPSEVPWHEGLICFFAALSLVGSVVYVVYSVGKWIVGLI